MAGMGNAGKAPEWMVSGRVRKRRRCRAVGTGG